MGIRNLLSVALARVCKRETWLARRVTAKLKLDDEQKQHLLKIEEALRGLRRDIDEGKSYRCQEMLQLLGRERLDREEALRLVKIPMAMANDNLPSTVAYFGDFYDTLTAEQRARLREWLSRRFIGRALCAADHCSAG
jgi:Spy/CpxP family protein refolding chaperone